jgi:DNA repair exonuclease SbcCD nuclease subunit
MLILFAGDNQLGKAFKFKRNAEIGVSERTIDLLKPMIEIANHAIDHDVKIVVFCGDLYDRTSINSTIKKLFRKYVLIPLRSKNIDVLVIGGNHDSPQQLNAGCDIEDLVISDKITVKRNMGTKIYTIDGEKIGFVVLPFLTPETVWDVNINEDGKHPRRSETVEPTLAAEYISKVTIPAALKELDGCTAKILIGHYHVLGTRASNMPDGFIDKEIAFNRTQLHEEPFDLSVFGHIHAPQELGTKIVVPGSTERMSFGERSEDKRFIVYDTAGKKWESIPLQSRKMIQLDFRFEAKETNPTGEILQSIMAAGIEDALVKIVVYASPDVLGKVDYDSIERATTKAFHAIIETVNSSKGGDGSAVSFTISEIANPAKLMESYIKATFKDDGEDRIKALIEKTRTFMGFN